MKTRLCFVVLIVPLLLLVCSESDNTTSNLNDDYYPVLDDMGEQTVSTSHQPATRAGDITFTNVSEEVGLAGVRGDSFAWGDYNNDGYQDLLVKGSRLFENNGPPDWDFTEVTNRTGISGSGYAVWGDYNNDGFLDFFSVGHPYEYWDCLWMNQGPPYYTFINVTGGAGALDDSMPGLAAAWADYDRDGFLDIYVVNWRDGENIRYPDVLWHNNGDGTFTDVTVPAGVYEGSDPYAGMGVNWGDYNNDGWPDIHVSNYLVTPNYLYENNGDGTFDEVAHDKNAAGLAPAGGYYGHTAGSSWADYDHDGDLDMWVSNLAHTTDPRGFYTDYSQMLRNDGSSAGYSFTDVRDETGIEKKPYMSEDELHFGIAWGDYDNDGDLDMFIPQIKNYVDYAYSFFFENNGDGTFTDVSEDVGVRVWDSDGACWADYNNDGYIDLITEGKYHYESGKYEVRLFRNNGGSSNSWLKVGVEASESNTASIGARVYVEYDGTTQMKEIEGGTAGHAYQHSLIQHFGFGDYSGAVNVTVWWPSGMERTWHDVTLGQTIFAREHNHDLRASKIWFSDPDPAEGEIITITAYIRNTGNNRIDSANIEFYDGDVTSNPIESRQIINVDPGTEIPVEIIWDTTDLEGLHTITAQISGATPSEDYMVNNEVSEVIEVVKYILDLTISSISFSDSNPEEGESIYIAATVKNTGNQEAESAFVEFYDGETYGILLNIIEVTGIESGSQKTVQIPWDTTGEAGNHTIRVIVTDCVPEEEDTTNNEAIEEIEVREPGENGDVPPSGDSNHAPEISSFYAEPQTILPNETVTLTVIAQDPEDDFLTYTYETMDGVISGTGSTVNWLAPEHEGIYEITVTVKDPYGAADSESTEIEVVANRPPHIVSIKASPDSVENNGLESILFTARVEDTNGLSDVESVRIDLTSVGGSGKQRMYDDASHGDKHPDDGVYSCEITIPEGIEPGEKILTVTAYDISGGLDSEDVVVTIMGQDGVDKEKEGISVPYQLLLIGAILVAVVLIVYIIFGTKNRASDF